MAITHIESHFHYPGRDTIARSLNMADTEQILNGIWACSPCHVHQTIDGCRCNALSAVEGEEPPFAAAVTVIDTKNAIPENAKAGTR